MSLHPFKKLKSLLNKSTVLQMEIERESRQKYPDWMKVITLKKQRLIIKDAIYKLRKCTPRAHYATS